MSSREFTEWIAYAALEPFGPQVEQRRHAEVRAHLHNLIPQKKGAKVANADDFLPKADQLMTDAGARLRALRGDS